jgi:hypothetical protein
MESYLGDRADRYREVGFGAVTTPIRCLRVRGCRSRLGSVSACNPDTAPLSEPIRVLAEIESGQVLRLRDGTAGHRCVAHAACGIGGAMPHPGLCRMPAPWQRPELFLARVIRHSPAPAEDRNTELATIRFAQAHLAVTFVIDPKTRLGSPTAWGRRGSSPKNKKGC